MKNQMKPLYDVALVEGAETITLGDQQVALKPTLGAAISISRAFGGLLEAQRRVLLHDIEAIGAVIAAGLGRNDEIEVVTAEVFQTGVDDLVGQTGNFVAALATAGGRKKAPAEGAARGKD